MLHQACLAAVALEHVVVSVNVSASQFARADFGAIVRHALQVSGLPPHRLCLELTESEGYRFCRRDSSGTPRARGALGYR